MVEGVNRHLPVDVAGLVAQAVDEMRPALAQEAVAATRQESQCSILSLRSELAYLCLKSCESTIDLAAVCSKLQDLENDVTHVGQQPGVDANFTADWQCVLGFFVWHTTHGSGTVGDALEQAPFEENSPLTPVLVAPPAFLQNLIKDMADLRDRISSRAVTITPPHFNYTIDWVTHHLPSGPDQALVWLEDPTLLHITGCEFSTNLDTRYALYHNKKAGISTHVYVNLAKPSSHCQHQPPPPTASASRRIYILTRQLIKKLNQQAS
jgi:hypothetical protein